MEIAIVRPFALSAVSRRPRRRAGTPRWPGGARPARSAGRPGSRACRPSRTAAAASSSDRSSERAEEDRAASRLASATVLRRARLGGRARPPSLEDGARRRRRPGPHERAGQHGGESPGTPAAGRLRLRARPGRPQLRLRQRRASLDELALHARSGRRRGRRPTRRRPPAGPRGRARRPAGRGPPTPARRAQVTAHGAADGVLGEPRGQPRPRGEQRLVGHLEAVAVPGEQPARRPASPRPGGERGVGAGQGELGARQPAARAASRRSSCSASRTRIRRAGVAGLARQRGERRLRRARHRAGDAAGREVARQRQRAVRGAAPTSPPAPSTAAAAPRSAEDVAHRDVGELRLDRAARPPAPAPRRPGAARSRSSAAP